MRLMNKRTWWPATTEILTTKGWEYITKVENVEDIIGYDKNKFKSTKILEVNIIKEYNGVLDYYRDGKIFLCGKSISLLEGKINRVGYSIPCPELSKIKYEGPLFNIVTCTNTLITRNFEETDEGDYIISKCNHEL